MGLKLQYKGSIRRFNGQGMSFGYFENSIPLEEVNKKHSTAVEGAFISINEVLSDTVSFSIFYYEKESKYTLKKDETITYKYDGNAFGFEFVFSLRG